MNADVDGLSRSQEFQRLRDLLRSASHHRGFQDRRIRPLCHPSEPMISALFGACAAGPGAVWCLFWCQRRCTSGPNPTWDVLTPPRAARITAWRSCGPTRSGLGRL